MEITKAKQASHLVELVYCCVFTWITSFAVEGAATPEQVEIYVRILKANIHLTLHGMLFHFSFLNLHFTHGQKFIYLMI